MRAFSTQELRAIKTRKPTRPTQASEARSKLLEALAAEPAKPPYSSVVLAGLVRSVEFVVIVAIAILVHRLYVAPSVGYTLSYFVIATAVAALSLLVFQGLQT